jgi:CO/xanthine dehydrogenase Mo-binding subunit
MPATSWSVDLGEKVSGVARYAADLLGASTPIVGLVRSPFAHARILRVDLAEALATPGVLGGLTGADFDGYRLGAFIADQPILAGDRVRYVGEPVVAIVAEDPVALRQGIGKVRIHFDPLRAVFSAEDALAAPFAIHDAYPDNVAASVSLEHGEWDSAVARVAVWAEGKFEVRPVWHAYMEPYATIARYEPGRVTLHVATHSPHSIKGQYEPWSERWGDTTIEIRTPVIGGSFGAKYEHPIHLICAEFAYRLRRDVGSVMSRREDFGQATPRVSMRMRVRLGASAEGDLLVKETNVLADNGAYGLDAPMVLGAAAVRIDNLYRYKAVRAEGKLVYTNSLPTQCFRGFGSPQSAFAQEQLVDELAGRLGLSPFEIRRRNAVREGDETVHGWRIGACGLTACLDGVETALARERINVDNVPPPPIRDPGGRYAIGVGIAAGTHVISNRTAAPAEGDHARVRLRVTAAGRVELFSSEVEVGGGTVHVFRGLAAQGLRVEPGDIDVILGDTALAPSGLGSFASRTTFFAGNAILDATARLCECIEVLRDELSLPSTAPLVAVAKRADDAGRLGELELVGEYVADGVEPHDESWRGNVSPSYTFGVHACTVQVDTWTGRVEVLRYWAAHDAGTILHEAGARGQVHGGVLQGLGFALSEKVVIDEGQGRALNSGFLDFRIPTFPDRVPVEILFVKTYAEAGPLGAKSIAEAPIIPVAACVANAVYDATGTRVRLLPMEPETVYRALHEG